MTIPMMMTPIVYVFYHNISRVDSMGTGIRVPAQRLMEGCREGHGRGMMERRMGS